MRIEVSETFSAHPERIFEALTDFESHLKRWTRGVVKVRRTSPQERGEGTTYEIVGRNFGPSTRVTWEYQVTAYDPARRFAGKAVGGPLPFHEEFTLTPVQEGTRLDLVQELDTPGRYGVAGPLLKLAWTKLLRQNLRRLRNLTDGK